jgi:hypothetical protein
MNFINIVEVLSVCNQDFQDKVIAVRRKFNFPLDVTPDTYDLLDFMEFDKKFLTDTKLRLEYDSEIIKLINMFRLKGLWQDLDVFVETGYIGRLNDNSVDQHSYYFFDDNRKPGLQNPNWEFMKSAFPWFTLIVKRRLTAKNLDKIYEEIKPKILRKSELYFGKFQEHYIYIPTFDRVKEIFKLKNDGKKFSEIAEILLEEHPEWDDESARLNEFSIKSQYNYFKKKYGVNSKSLQSK